MSAPANIPFPPLVNFRVPCPALGACCRPGVPAGRRGPVISIRRPVFRHGKTWASRRWLPVFLLSSSRNDGAVVAATGDP